MKNINLIAICCIIVVIETILLIGLLTKQEKPINQEEVPKVAYWFHNNEKVLVTSYNDQFTFCIEDDCVHMIEMRKGFWYKDVDNTPYRKITTKNTVKFLSDYETLLFLKLKE